tara:strand:- start:266 stop:577 length:312 start_codon:yes stop_codon:yes gene_type:complete
MTEPIPAFGIEGATEEEVQTVAAEFAKRFSHIPLEDHLRIVSSAYGNYFGKEGFKRWYEKTAPVLTSEDIEELRDSCHLTSFLYTESHLVPDGAATPLYELRG